MLNNLVTYITEAKFNALTQKLYSVLKETQQYQNDLRLLRETEEMLENERLFDE